MNQQTKNVVLINASPRAAGRSISNEFLSQAEGKIEAQGMHVLRIDVRTSKNCDKYFEAMQKADALVFAYPLYIFCLSGMMIRFLQDYDNFLRKNSGANKTVNVYAIVNCGFPEPELNEESLRVMQSFCRHIGAAFRFGISCCGPMLQGVKDAPFAKKAIAAFDGGLALIAKDIASGDDNRLENITITVKFPRRFYFFMGNKGWFSMASKNGLKKKDLYRRPYQQ